MSKHLNFAAALKSFEGYLEGTSKSEHTIRNYHFDLLAFEKFLLSYDKRPEVKLEELDQSYIEEFHNWLKKDGLKTNTRRRKLHTVRKFLGYLSRRKKVPETLDRKVAAPQKVERIPFIVPSEVLIGAIRALPVETVLDRRNRILLWTLAETGCQVSELRQIRFEDWQCSDEHSGNCALRLHGKAGRTLPVSRDLLAAVQELPLNATDYLFIGFNKFGPLGLGGAITARGVELLVRSYASRLLSEEAEELTPRTFRHSAVVHWYVNGIKRDEIQKRLGLKTAYAFRSYEPLFAAHTVKSSS